MASAAEDAAEEEADIGEPRLSSEPPQTVPAATDRSGTVFVVNGSGTARSETASVVRSATELLETAIARVTAETFNTRDWPAPLSPGGEYPSEPSLLIYRPIAQ